MLTYLHLDVFTDRLFAGNQLAVYLDPPRDLGDTLMQAIAREMAFSETTFVFPPDAPGTDYRVRIFTPGSELPMAGHPTIGTTFALAHEGVIAAGRDRFVFGLGVGPTPVELQWNDAVLAFAWMDQRRPEYRDVTVSLEELTRAIGVDHEGSAIAGLPAEE